MGDETTTIIEPAKKLRVLIACEFSQIVTKEFRKRGHEAYSCDLIAAEGGHPEWHIMHDAVEVAYSGCWDRVIAFPPCTFISKVSNAFFNVQKYGDAAIERRRKSEGAMIFFKKLYDCPCDHVAIENPVGFMNSRIKPTQIIQPWYFGDPVQKTTCLWLRGLTRLNGNPTHIKPDPIRVREGKRNRNVTWAEELLSSVACHKERAKIRSKTFPGIAACMARTWSPDLTIL